MDILKVKGNIYCIDIGMIYILFYKINDEKIIMLDMGWKKEECDGIVEVLESNNFKVLVIINSYVYIDYIGNNEYFKNKYNLIIVMFDFEVFICSFEINFKVFYGS